MLLVIDQSQRSIGSCQFSVQVESQVVVLFVAVRYRKVATVYRDRRRRCSIAARFLCKFFFSLTSRFFVICRQIGHLFERADDVGFIIDGTANSLCADIFLLVGISFTRISHYGDWNIAV